MGKAKAPPRLSGLAGKEEEAREEERGDVAESSSRSESMSESSLETSSPGFRG